MAERSADVGAPAATTNEVIDTLHRLNAAHAAGNITEQDFESCKAELVALLQDVTQGRPAVPAAGSCRLVRA